jgi:hypothetical protein
MATDLPGTPHEDNGKVPKNASIDLRTLLKGDLAGLLTGGVYSASTLAFDKTGKSAAALCFFTVISIGITRIGSSFIDLYKKWAVAMEGTHYEALQSERKHHLECREANTKIYAELAHQKSDYTDAIGRLQSEFDAYKVRHEHEYQKVTLQRDFLANGYENLVQHLRESEGNRRHNPDSDPKASVMDVGQNRSPDRGGQ